MMMCRCFSESASEPIGLAPLRPLAPVRFNRS